MYTNQLMMGSSVHTIKTKFINKFIPPGGRLLLKETVITERQRGGGIGWMGGGWLGRGGDERQLCWQ